jgi:hypothetical protein
MYVVRDCIRRNMKAVTIHSVHTVVILSYYFSSPQSSTIKVMPLACSGSEGTTCSCRPSYKSVTD